MDTPLLKEEQNLSARHMDFHGCRLPDVFSSFDAEYRAARERVAIFDTNWHAMVELTGPDRVRYLNAIVSNDIKKLGEEFGTLALLLNPQGHILAELEVYALQDKLLVFSHASVRKRTVATLEKFIIMDDVTLSDVSERFGTVGVEGPRAGSIIAEASGLSLEGFSEHALAEVKIAGVACHLIRHSHFGGPGAEIVAPRDHISLLWNFLYASVHSQHGLPVGMRTLNALRLEAGVPWFPDDFNDTVIPQEAALEDTHISFNKGCYTGQEIVERVRSRGQVNRRRTRLKFSFAEPPVALTRLRTKDAEAKEVGIVTSSAFSPAAGTAIGMGYVRREHSSPGSILELDGGTAEVIA
ncbi:MAG: glycine cleavage T C-terminal barrel domain-containing protein [Candidatus Acidiferrales bacterium]